MFLKIINHAIFNIKKWFKRILAINIAILSPLYSKSAGFKD